MVSDAVVRPVCNRRLLSNHKQGVESRRLIPAIDAKATYRTVLVELYTLGVDFTLTVGQNAWSKDGG